MTARSQPMDFPAAIVALVPDIRLVVTGALRRQGEDPALAEDLIQEVVATLLGNASTYRPELGALAPWARGVAMNVVKNCTRKRQRYQRRFGPDHGEAEACVADAVSPERHAQVHEVQARAAEILSHMPRNQRDVFCLIAGEELSHREVAERLGISEVAAKQRYHRAREYLTRTLGLSLDDHLGAVVPPIPFDEPPPEARRQERWRTLYEHTCRWALFSSAIWAFLLAGARPVQPSWARVGLHVPPVRVAVADVPSGPATLGAEVPPALPRAAESRAKPSHSPPRKAEPRLVFSIQGITPGDDGGSSR